MTRAWCFALTAVSVASHGAVGFAQGMATTPLPPIEADLQGYYGGERTSAYVIGGVGLAAAGAGGVLVTHNGNLDRGLGITWLSMGTLELVASIFYAVQVGSEISHYELAIARSPGGFQAEELAHMHGTSSRFVIYRAVEIAFAVAGAGVGAYGLAANRPTFTGIGIGVLSLSLPLVVIDTINDRRATRYIRALQGFQPAVSAVTPVGERAWTVSLTGRF